ncbi:disks large-associated protein 5-like isoform X2 [Hemicordylus capensis]|uniref:disks large-associated protein 5-like isoform X2 n=1 Tax=Hemicordylus capensis TaxID=884348 RepID=UPI00230411F1|nr:disks large-associated protein 5-like isoform X2 [Hemicordylus capensis]
MAVASQFATQYRKQLSPESLGAQQAYQKSSSQRENRRKDFEKSRKLDLPNADLPLEKRIHSHNPEATEDTKAKQNPTIKAAPRKREHDRREMLRRYKEEKELRKLNEQREKANKRGAFITGIYRPEPLAAVVPLRPLNVKLIKPKEKTAVERTNRGNDLPPAPLRQRQACTDNIRERGSKEAPKVITRAAASGINREMSKPARFAGKAVPRRTCICTLCQVLFKWFFQAGATIFDEMVPSSNNCPSRKPVTISMPVECLFPSHGYMNPQITRSTCNPYKSLENTGPPERKAIKKGGKQEEDAAKKV